MPYPGKYITTALTIQDVKEKEPVPFSLHINNLGNDDLKQIYSIFSVYNNNGKKLASAQSQQISLKSKDSSTISAFLEPNNLLPATYTVEAVTYYDGETKRDNATFKVGTLYIDIINFTKEIESGSIQKFYVSTESKWNDPINDVYAIILINNLTGKKIIETRTRGYDFKSFEKKDIESFIDTSNIKPGEYIVELTLNYKERTSSKKSTLIITENSSGKKKDFNMSLEFFNSTNIVIILLIIIILLLLVFDLFIIKKKKGDPKLSSKKL